MITWGVVLVIKQGAGVKISIVTVCFNSSKTIEQTIKSVINQSYKNIEYIIIDGGSTDGTLDIIREYEPYITYWVSEPDKGIYDAMNKGIQVATGELIAFLNSDDWYEEGILEYCADAFDKTNADVLYGDMVVVDSNGKIIKRLSPKNTDLDNMLYETVVYHPSTFVKTSIMRKRPFDTKYHICADIDLFTDLYVKNYRFQYLGETCFAYFRVGGCSTTSPIACRKEVYIVGKKYLKYFENQSVYSLAKYKLRNIRLYVFLLEYKNKIGVNYKNKIKKIFLKKNIDKIYIFGAGKVGKIVAELLSNIGINFVVVDNSSYLQGTTLCGRKVQAASNLKPEKNAVVFITKSGDTTSMIKQLEQYNFVRKDNFFDFQDWCKYLLLLKYNRLNI